ncbi:MAG: tRNA (N6-threonylcarbamoyladenosine(37)-N6)-methyltransferase TrmO [Chloroflexaceae bacterium]|nr:tRNA (N6-threonylcarbamoyladenosine(37)-N6)-methyltransferase TrmO [Chloroflexaceae bacterium]
METEAPQPRETYQVYPVGYVRRRRSGIDLDILEPFRPALTHLDGFSHVIVLWWFNEFDTEEHRARLHTKPPYAEDRETGVFATRAPHRPNPIALTTCKILEVNEEQGVVRVADIDAYDGTPILDLKAYFPVCDRVQYYYLPRWLSGWPEWMPEEGLGLMEMEEE